MMATLLEGAIVGFGAFVVMIALIAGLMWVMSNEEEDEP